MQQFDSFAQMQRDAERRVMEMQKRAMAAVEGSDPPPILLAAPTADRDEGAPFDSAPPDSAESSDEGADPSSAPLSPLNELFPGLNLSDEDAERALILAILLLVREQADRNLVLLLLYLLV